MDRGSSNVSVGEVADHIPSVLLAIVFDYLTFVPLQLSLFKIKSTEDLYACGDEIEMVQLETTWRSVDFKSLREEVQTIHCGKRMGMDATLGLGLE